LFLLFRQQIVGFMPEIVKRLKKAEIPGGKFEFSDMQKAAVNALPDAIEEGAQAYRDKPDQLAGFVRDQLNKLPELQETRLPTGQSNLTGRSILWVDDQPMNNVYESSVLKRLGASIVSARSTDEALAFLRQDRFDLVISDVGREENDRRNPTAGYELLEKLDGRYPLIVYTSSLARLNQERARLAFGAADTPRRVIELAVQALESNM